MNSSQEAVCTDMEYELGGKGGQRRLKRKGELVKEEKKRSPGVWSQV